MNIIISSLIAFFFLVSGNVFAESFNTKEINVQQLSRLRVFPIPFPLFQPDLVVTEFRTTGAVTVRTDGFQEVPVRVVVENQGNGIAQRFMLSARYITSRGDFMRPFTVPGQSSQWKPQTMASLYPNETVAIEGKLVGFPSSSGETVDFYIKADSCDGDEFMPSYCRVRESDETNNESDRIPVTLP